MPRLALLILLAGLAALPSSGQTTNLKGKKLIEFGWDEPDTAFLRAHIAEMQRTPFDGCVFHALYAKTNGARGNFTWESWGGIEIPEASLRGALDDLRGVRLGRFKNSFLRFNTTPATLDWFDDYSAVLANATLAARLARAGRCPGLLFDTEQYDGKLFNYAKQRDVKSKSWDLYAAQARRRGGEVMRAFHQGYPGLTLFLTFGDSLPWAESGGGTKALADCSYGLLVPFLDGMIEAARGGEKIVDGFEESYGYKTNAAFLAGRKSVKEDVLAVVLDPAGYRRVVSAGFGLWLDFDSSKKAWSAGEPSTNYFTPGQFQRSARWALQWSDEYVWIYSQTPRWWSAAGTPVALPESYDTALRQAREK